MWVPGTGAPGSSFTHLNPGGPPNLTERIPIHFVFVGYDPSQVNQAAFLAQLPTRVGPVVRSRLWYGMVERLGLHYAFQYRVSYTDAAYENQFFTALRGMATPADRTLFQDLYNAQIKNVLDVGQNHFIDAPSVEKWLIDHPPAGVDTRMNTVFFVNWWTRTDFLFHVYTKFGEPDPDTNYDFGVNRHSRKIIAWGGTTPDDEETGLGAARGIRRVWFYDLSAGPEAWTDNWNVDDRDVDGDGVGDYRMPPIWEYFANGYHAMSALSSDLGKVARFVAINLLFAPSPIYPPYLTPDRQPASINLDLNTYEGWRNVDASTQYQKPALVAQEVGELIRVPRNTDQQDVPFVGEALRCYNLWLVDVPCYPARPYPGFANLFVNNALNLAVTQDGGGEYEAMDFNYATGENKAAGFLGFADDNWIDGTQSGVFSFVSPGVVAAGYGLTTTQIHEYGHHFGMSHPHDGYDSELGLDYGPEGPYYFAWSGDESNSMMSYVDLNWDFSQFDRDNANRFLATAYIRGANQIAEDILASPNAPLAMGDLTQADAEIGLAKAALAAHDYVATYDRAKRAYDFVRAGAVKAGVPVIADNSGWVVLPASAAARQSNRRQREIGVVDKFGPGTHRSKP
ncbi:MAG: hypothetical protein ACRDF5_00025 [bacterium]